MNNKEITERLELILGCMIGSHTTNRTPEEQIELLIADLKAKNNESLHLVRDCVKCGEREGKGKTKQCDTCLMDGIV